MNEEQVIQCLEFLINEDENRRWQFSCNFDDAIHKLEIQINKKREKIILTYDHLLQMIGFSIITFFSIYFQLTKEKDQIKTNNSNNSTFCRYLFHFMYIMTITQILAVKIKSFYFYLLIYSWVVVLLVLISDTNYQVNVELYFFMMFLLAGLLIILAFGLLDFYIDTILSHSVLLDFSISIPNRSRSLIIAFINCVCWQILHYFILFQIYQIISELQNQNFYNQETFKQILMRTRIPLIIFFTFLWTISLYGCIIYSKENIKNHLKNVKQEIQLRGQLMQNLLFVGGISGQVDIHLSHIHLLFPIYFYLGQHVIRSFSEEISQETVDQWQLLRIIYLCLSIPIFLMQGNIICHSNIEKNKLYFWNSLISQSISVLIMTMQYKLSQQGFTFLGIAPVINCIFWITVDQFILYSSQKRWLLIFLYNHFMLFPGIMLQFSDVFSSSFDVKSVTLLFQVLIFIFLGIFALMIVHELFLYLFDYLFQKQKYYRLRINCDFSYYLYANIQQSSHWIICTVFNLTCYSLTFIIFNQKSKLTHAQTGKLIALVIISIMQFILTNQALFFKVRHNDQLLIFASADIFKKKVINVLGFAIPIALFIYALIEDEVIQRVICIFLLVGTPLLVFHFNLMLQIRKAAPKFHSTCLPLFIIYEQILVIFPIGGIFPVIACQLEIQELDYASFSQFQVVYSLLIFSFMMVFFVVFFLIVFNKYELFLKKTLVVKQMMQIFATYRIKATQKNCTFILDLFINDESKTVSSLLERELVAFEEVPIVLADQYKWELVKKYQQQKYQEQSESQSQILNQMEDVNIQNHNQTLKWTKKLINYFYQCLFCRIGKKQIMEFEKQQREIIVDLIELIQWKESKVYQEKFQQQNNNCKFLDYFEKFKKTSQNDVFYQKLKYDQSQQLKFWVSVYEIFQNDLTQFIDLMNWNIDHQVLEQYNFVSINQEATEINFENFVLLLNDHVQEYQEESVNNLWSFAILKYPLLISLCINLKEFIQTIQPKEFQYKQFFKKKQLRISQVGVLRQQLTCQNTETQDNVEEEYQENLKQIIKKKDSKNARELKCWKICFTIHKFLWMTPINFLKKHFACLSNSNFYTILGILPLKQKVEKDENLESEILNQIVQILEKSKQDRPNAEKEMNFNIKNQYKQWTTSDLIEYISRFYDYLTLFLMTIDFYFEFQFDVNLKFPTLFFNVIFLDFAAFQHTLIIACTVSVGYFIVGMIGLYLIIINKFDMNIEGQINYTWFSKVIKYILIVFGALYLNVMKIYMDAFICDYSNYPFTLIREPSIECFENKHWIYILIASTGSILYYLTSAFLKPVLQKYDFDLNLKYSSTYVVLYMQYQLLFVVVRSTFQHYQEQLAKIIQFIILLIFTMTLQFFFFIFENKWKLYFKIEFSVLCVISAIYCSLILKWWVPLGWNLAILIYIIFGAIAVFIRELQKIYRVHAWERNQNRNREF